MMPAPPEPVASPPGRPLVLASTSRYRRELLSRLGLPFTAVAPTADETPLPAETPAMTALRLAAQKARSIASDWPLALIIGSDQVADADGVAIGKPGNAAAARAQLARLSGRTVVFHTGVALLDAATGECRTALVDVRSRFRALSPATIDAYLAREQPYDCAGSVKSEGLGIALFEAIESDDPTALVGLPLICVVGMLAAAGIALP